MNLRPPPTLTGNTEQDIKALSEWQIEAYKFLEFPVFPGGVNIGNVTNYTGVSNVGVTTLHGTAKRKLTLRPIMNMAEMGKNEKPTVITVGIWQMFSLPIWAAPADSDEQLVYELRVPYRWDGVSDFAVPFHVALGAGEDVGDKFKLQLSWEHDPCGGIIPATSNPLEVETTVLAGRNAQFDCYEISFTIDYDIDGAGNEIVAGELLGGRLRRVAASASEITGEVLVRQHTEIEQVVDKMFGSW